MQHRSINFDKAKELYQKDRSCGSIIKSPRLFGVEFEMVPKREAIMITEIYRELHNSTEKIVPKTWGVGHDASISDGGIEVQSPPMRLSLGEQNIKEFCSGVMQAGWITDHSCGVHVHLDAGDIVNNNELIRRLFLLYFVIDYCLLSMLPVARRSNRYCAPLDSTRARGLVRHTNERYEKGFKIDTILSTRPTEKDFLEMFYKKPYSQIPSELRNHYNEARYHGINFHSLFSRYHTVEIRYLEGTLDSNTILNWIAFHQHIVDNARLIREVEAIELFHIKGPKTRLKRFAELIGLPEYLHQWARSRIDMFKE